MKHLTRKLGAAALLALMLLPVAHAEIYTPVDLPLNEMGANIRNWSGGSVYNALYPNSSQTLAGVPFQFASNANGNNVISSGTHIIPVGIDDVRTVYTLINTAWGSPGALVGSLTFISTDGDSFTANLIEGYNVRDHYYGGYVNTTSSPDTIDAVWGINAPGYAHLDLQIFSLPESFWEETLDRIVFVSSGGYSGAPFLAALTVGTVPVVDSVPEPGTWSLLLGSLALMGGLARRRQSLQ